jgi:predicted ATP-binding protein involved in virulence
MKLLGIKITKLFDLFDYDISLENEENLLILTGPNGFGKTMILNIIYNFFNKRFFFFHWLIFEKIELILENDTSVSIYKTGFHFIKNKEIIEWVDFPDKMSMTKYIEINHLFIKQTAANKWIDTRTNATLTVDDLLYYTDSYTNDLKYKDANTLRLFDQLRLFIIKEQRLFQKINIGQRNSTFGSEEADVLIATIHECAKALSQNIHVFLQKSFHVSQELDSSFPKRLLSEAGQIDESDFARRFDVLKTKQSKLKQYGLSESEQEVPVFDQENAKVLLVYLNDTEKKIGVFDDLITRLELFSNTLNERRFTFKTIKIDQEKGFIFLTSNGKELNLTDLSSGEQHEVVLLYELIFRTGQNTLVLIDEPEISLHITWQKEFLNDLLKIIALQKMQVVVATHSPQIINGRWDLVHNLEAKYAP